MSSCTILNTGCSGIKWLLIWNKVGLAEIDAANSAADTQVVGSVTNSRVSSASEMTYIVSGGALNSTN